MIQDSTQNPENLKQNIINGDKSFAIKRMRISKNSNILPDLVRINFIHAGAIELHGKPS